MSLTTVLRCSAALLAAGLLLSTPLSANERSFDGAYGQVKLGGDAQRVVALGDTALDAALSLGVQPVGTLASRGGTDVPDYLKDKAGKITLVGSVREPNLEAILRLQPDLILASSELPRDLFTKLNMMAPTVVPKGNAFEDWRQTYRDYAGALNKAEEGEQRISAIEARVAELRKGLPQGEQVSIVRWNPQGPAIMSSHLFAGQLLQELGFTANALAAAQERKPHSDVLSLENLARVDADWVFLATLNPDGRKALEDARKQPAFTRLKAVGNDRVISVDGQVWSSSAGYIAAQHILDDVEKAVKP